MKTMTRLVCFAAALALTACAGDPPKNDNRPLTKEELKVMNDASQTKAAREALEEMDGITYDFIDADMPGRDNGNGIEAASFKITETDGQYSYRLQITMKGGESHVAEGAAIAITDSDRFGTMDLHDFGAAQVWRKVTNEDTDETGRIECISLYSNDEMNFAKQTGKSFMFMICRRPLPTELNAQPDAQNGASNGASDASPDDASTETQPEPQPQP